MGILHQRPGGQVGKVQHMSGDDPLRGRVEACRPPPGEARRPSDHRSGRGRITKRHSEVPLYIILFKDYSHYVADVSHNTTSLVNLSN